MASPHAAGLAALLVSALAQEKQPYDAPATSGRRSWSPPSRCQAPPSWTRAPVSPMSTAPIAGSRPRGRCRISRCGPSGPGDANGAVLASASAPRPTPCRRFELSPSGRRRAGHLHAPERRALAHRAGHGRRCAGPRTTRAARAARDAALARARRVRRDGDRLDRRYAGGPGVPAGDHGRRAPRRSPPAPQQLRDGVAVPAGGTLRTFFQADSAPAVRADGRDRRPRGTGARVPARAATACRSATRAPARPASARRPPSTRPTRATWWRARTSRWWWRRPSRRSPSSVERQPVADHAPRDPSGDRRCAPASPT